MNNTKLPVSILHYASAPIIGGVEGIMSDHRALLARYGHPVQIVAGRGAPDLLLPEIDSRDPLVLETQRDLDAGHVPSSFEPLRHAIAQKLAAAFDNIGGGAVLAHNAFTLHKNIALAAALWDLAATGRYNIVAWCHDLAWTNPLYAAALHDGYPWDLLRRPAPGVTYVAISRERQLELAGLFGLTPDKIRRVPNGIDPAKLLPAGAELRSLYDALDFPARDLILLAPVRMTRRKNLELAIRTVAELKANGIRPLLLITGPPGPHNPVQDYADFLFDERTRLDLADEVSFLSKLPLLPNGVSDALIGELYHWSDAMLFTSEQEGFGLPILEAALARLPIFCSSLPVLREAGGDDAHYFDPHSDPQQIAAMLTETLAQPGPARLRRRVMRNYGWDAIYQHELAPILARNA